MAGKALRRPKRQYSDEDKAATLLTLESNGGNVLRTARETGIPQKTIAEWRNNRGTPAAVAKIRDENRAPLIERLTEELNKAITALDNKREDASYADLMRGIGILTDKVQLLGGQDTARVAARVHVTYGRGSNEDEDEDASDS